MERPLISLLAKSQWCCRRLLIKDYCSRKLNQTVNYCVCADQFRLAKVKMKIETFCDVRKRKISIRHRDIPITHQNYAARTSDMATLIDGKKIAQDIRLEVKDDIQKWVAKGNRNPQLTAILVGEDHASEVYVRNKMKAAEEVGITSITKRFPCTISECDLLNEIERLNQDPCVDGILVQLPLPAHIDEQRVCNAVNYEKDVDGFNELNIGRLCLDMGHMIPCTPLGVYELLKRYKIETFGKNAVVVGRSKHVSMPIAMLLHTDGKEQRRGMDATVTICHRYTPPEDLKKHCLQADIIVVAAGVPGLIKADMVKQGACIIDIGINRVNDPVTGKEKLVGDVDFENVRPIVDYITPVPGGVGPMTVAMLMKNTLIAAQRSKP